MVTLIWRCRLLTISGIGMAWCTLLLHRFSVSVWQFDKASLEVRHMTSLSGHVSGVKAVDCDAIRCVTASRDRTLRVWALKTGDEISLIRLAGKILWAKIGTIRMAHLYFFVSRLIVVSPSLTAQISCSIGERDSPNSTSLETPIRLEMAIWRALL